MIPAPTFILLSAWQLLALPCCLIALAWFAAGALRRSTRNVERARDALFPVAQTDRSDPSVRLPLPQHDVWIWNPRTQAHERSQLHPTHLDP